MELKVSQRNRADRFSLLPKLLPQPTLPSQPHRYSAIPLKPKFHHRYDAPFYWLRKFIQLALLLCSFPSNFYIRTWAYAKRSSKNQFGAVALVCVLYIQTWVYFCTWKNFEISTLSCLVPICSSPRLNSSFYLVLFYIPLFSQRPRYWLVIYALNICCVPVEEMGHWLIVKYLLVSEWVLWWCCQRWRFQLQDIPRDQSFTKHHFVRIVEG